MVQVGVDIRELLERGGTEGQAILRFNELLDAIRMKPPASSSHCWSNLDLTVIKQVAYFYRVHKTGVLISPPIDPAPIILLSKLRNGLFNKHKAARCKLPVQAQP